MTAKPRCCRIKYELIKAQQWLNRNFSLLLYRCDLNFIYDPALPFSAYTSNVYYISSSYLLFGALGVCIPVHVYVAFLRERNLALISGQPAQFDIVVSNAVLYFGISPLSPPSSITDSNIHRFAYSRAL